MIEYPHILMDDVFYPETEQILDDRMLDEKLEDRVGPLPRRPFPKEGFKASIYLAYNTAALEAYGENVGERMIKIYSYLEERFQHESLGVLINLTLAGYGHWDIDANTWLV